MNDEGIEWAIREVLKLRDRVSALEAAQPAPLEFPVIEPERVPDLTDRQEWHVYAEWKAARDERRARIDETMAAWKMEPFDYTERN